MRRVYSVLIAAFLVVSFGSMAFARAITAPAASKAPAAKVAKTSAPPKAMAVKKASTLAVTGKVESYDEATKTLTVATKKGNESFTLGSDAKIMAGAKPAMGSDLVAGKNVKVTYHEADGKMTATRVAISAASKKAKTPKA